MKIFDDYANYYDLIYQDKNYIAEVEFIKKHLQTYAPAAQSILELGCGTGIHAVLLAEAGYFVHGVDISAKMLAQAEARLQQVPQQVAANLRFSSGNICAIDLDQQFDVVLALFHVADYQITNSDLQNFFNTAKIHLKPDGILIFDFWYGAAVLSDPPKISIKRLENDQIKILRIAEPTMLAHQNQVDVNYQILIVDKPTSEVNELRELHQMRYLFLPEIELFLENAGMKILKTGEWLTDNPLSLESWSGYCVAKVK